MFAAVGPAGRRYQSIAAATVQENVGSAVCLVEHSNSRFESIRYANRFESICFVEKSAFRFTSCHAVFLVYLLYSDKLGNA